jgi:hypothetical protein
MSTIDELYFEELAKCDPASICSKDACSYNAEEGTFSVSMWLLTHTIDPIKKTINSAGIPGYSNHEYFDLFVVYYLLKVHPEKIRGEWISEKDLPGGPTFFRGPHLIPTTLISERFSNDIDLFQKTCQRLGGIPVEMGDSAFTFHIAPGIPITVIYWIGDEDFPAEAKILYDRSIEKALTLDIIYLLAVETCHRLSSV